MWKIFDINNNKFTQIKDESIINIGNIVDCDIQIHAPKEKSTLIQLVLESNFIYFVYEKKIQVNIYKYEFAIFESRFQIEKIKT